MTTPLVRFAPSPTGRLHVGNVRAALFNWLFARKQGGSFMLRSDDTDQERSTKAFEEAIQADLAWLGLAHDSFARQSERFGRYDEVSDALRDRGLLYAAYETAEELDRKRKLQRARGLPPVYDRAALSLTENQKKAYEEEGRRPHWRFKLSRSPVEWDDMIRGPVTLDTATISDPVLIREDGMYLYTLPSCIDDVDFGVTHIIRGEDHVTNTAAQVEVFRALIEVKGEGALPRFGHHSLLTGAEGEGLSKRLGSLSVGQMREDGIEPQAVTSLLARLGTSDPVEPVLDLGILADGFDIDRLGRAPARFSMEELRALNAKVLHLMPYERVRDRLEALGVSEALWLAVRGNLERLEDAGAWREVAEGEVAPAIDEADREFCREAAGLVPDALGEGAWGSFVDEVKRATGRKGKGLFMPLRRALTGREAGPEMADLFPLIGSERARARLRGEAA
jgi:glutamyl-tRNA synthetase